MPSPNTLPQYSDQIITDSELIKQKKIEALKPDIQKITKNIFTFQQTYCASPNQFSKNPDQALDKFTSINYETSFLISKLYGLEAYQQTFELIKQISNYLTSLQTNTNLQQGYPFSLNEQINNKWAPYWNGLYVKLEKTCNNTPEVFSPQKSAKKAPHQSDSDFQLSSSIYESSLNFEAVLKTID